MHCLVVDDEYLPRGGTVRALEHVEQGATVHQAASLLEAFNALERSPDIELVVLDLNLGESSGIETLKRFRAWCDEHELHPRIVVLSGAGEDNPELVLDVLENFGTGFILKKNTPEQIFHSALKLTLAGGIFIPREILRLINLPSIPERGNLSQSESSQLVNFTPREREVAVLLIKGWTYKKIANELSKRQHEPLSEHTVRSHVGNMAWKLGIGDNIKPKSGVMAQLAKLGLRFSEPSE